jgi:hypothetical protein
MQGYRNILITLSFGSAATNSNGTEVTFYYRFPEWTGSEQVDRLFPISVWIPQSDAGSTVVISQAQEGQLFDIDGDLEMGDVKDNYGNYHPFIKIRAHNVYVHTAHKHFNKVTLFGKALPATKKDGTPLFEVFASKPNRNGQSVHRMKFAVEKTSSKKLEDGSYTQSESVFFNISANADETGKGKSSSLFPYLAGQHIFATGSLSISGSKGKVYTTVFVGGAHDFLQGVLAQTGVRSEPVKVKTFGVDNEEF